MHKMEFLKASNQEIRCGAETILLRGFGLGGWLLPEGYMWKLYTKCDRPRRMEAMINTLCGDEYGTYFWEQYYQYYITKEDIAWIAKEGFNSVRLPLNSRHLYQIEEGEFYFKPMITLVDELIAWCKEYQIYVILDMHGAPGGQTGQNIDDSENDQPELFQNEKYQEELCILWRELALRYKEEPTVAGYDLLNEPLPNWFENYNHLLMPLYRTLIAEIRAVDQNHMIILEGAHWATDFSIFEEFTKAEASDNIMLQFHKYWSNPDQESLADFISHSKRLNVPLLMGEGGENNCDWYTILFPLYERLHISWSFWSYKKMNCDNSPITFDCPNGWEQISAWLDGETVMSADTSKAIFNDFLRCIRTPKCNDQVIRSLKRQTPLTIPCEGYDSCEIYSKRKRGADLRMSQPVTLVFANGKQGTVDYRRHGGEAQPEEENVLVELSMKDCVSYEFQNSEKMIRLEGTVTGSGVLLIVIDGQEFQHSIEGTVIIKETIAFAQTGNQILTLQCEKGTIWLDTISLTHIKERG